MKNEIWEDPQLRQQLLDQLGSSSGKCCQFFHFKKDYFYFSENIRELIGHRDFRSCSLDQWYGMIYEEDRRRLRKYGRTLLQKPDERCGFNYRVQDGCGRLVWVSSEGRCFFDAKGEPEYFLGYLTPWNESREGGESARRTVLLQKLEELHHSGRDAYLLMMDVDDLSGINLKCGREFGDGVLQSLEDAMMSSDSRFSPPLRGDGGCFCVLATKIDEAELERYFDAVQKQMRSQCTVSGGCVSLQMYQVPESAVLIQYAESALKEAKLAGKKQLYFFNPENYERRLAAIELQADLEEAVRKNFAGFSLEYQLQVRSESFEPASAEALLRFCSPRRGKVSPTEFVPILESCGLIVPVGQWVLRTALEQCRRWRETVPSFRVGVNMSYVQLRRPEIQAEVLSALKESGLPGSALTLEVTEGIELQRYSYLNTIFSAWKKKGVEISVDDFGTGYSSLGWLKNLDIDEIKIDRCFVSGIQHSAYNLRLLTNILELASSGGLRVCCEGVENEEELVVLESLKPDLYQGFFFAKPAAPDALDLQAFGREMRQRCRQKQQALRPVEEIEIDQFKLEHVLLEKTEDLIAICDAQTHEIYYLNAAAQKIFGTQNYRGTKCYKIFRGKDSPCDFCPNALLRHDSFHIWESVNEYCDRHFLLKGKLIEAEGRTMRFQVGMDITKREYMGQKSRERLEFANQIVESVQLLGRQKDWREVVRLALASMGEFYKADRAYLFERNPDKEGCWDNRFEWCAPGVAPQQERLQQVPPDCVERWMENFAAKGSVIIYNMEPIRRKNLREWEVLNAQGIQRVIAVPLMNAGRVNGFIGVDNPRYAIQDDAQARVLAGFLTVRFRRERQEWREE